MDLSLTVDDWPPAPIRTERLVLRPSEARDRETFLDLGPDDEILSCLGFTEAERFEEFGAAQWLGVRQPG